VLLRIVPAITSLYSLLKIPSLGISLDSILITILLFGFSIYDIKYFSLTWLKILISKKLFNEKVLEYIKITKNKNDAEIYLLTACIEYPACLIAKMLSLNKCFGRGFITVGNRIIAVEPFHSYILKAKFLKRAGLSKDSEKIYVLDLYSALVERKLLVLFDKIIIVGPHGTILRSFKVF